MGSTVSVAKYAAVHVCDGVPYYALFEATYESNCWPHAPHVCCVAFGTLRQVLSTVLALAAATPGGMLKGRSGDITPAGYIRGWLRALVSSAPLIARKYVAVTPAGWDATAAALAAEIQSPGLRGAPIGHSDVADAENVAGIGARLRRNGHTTEAAELASTGAVTCDLDTQAAVLACICQEGERYRLQPWQVFCRSDAATDRIASLPLVRPRTPTPKPGVQVLDTGARSYGNRPILALYVADGMGLRWPEAPKLWAVGQAWELYERYLQHLANHVEHAPNAWDAVSLALASGRLFAPQRHDLLDPESVVVIDIGGADPRSGKYLREHELSAFTGAERLSPTQVRTTWARVRALDLTRSLSVSRYARFERAPTCQQLATLKSADGEVKARLYRAAPDRFMVSVQGRTSGQCDSFATLDAALTYVDDAVLA